MSKETIQSKRIAFLFPGQGAQYPRMGADFFEAFSAARFTFEEADALLGRPLSKLILEGNEEELTATRNSQVAIYTVSCAICRVVQELFDLQPSVCAGLSLGEYSALTAAEWLAFSDALPLVQKRAAFMEEACLSKPGAMAVIMGLAPEAIEAMIRELDIGKELWIANVNCPGQVVISGTEKGIELGVACAKARQAKRAIPLQVQGAFHSGLMLEAEKKLAPFIEKAPLKKGAARISMNVPGGFCQDEEQVKKNLIQQVTQSVKWEQSVRAIEREGVDLYIEFGPGKTLSGMNRRIGVAAPTLSVETIADLKQLELSIK